MRLFFDKTNVDGDRGKPASTAQYTIVQVKETVAPRPEQSDLNLPTNESFGFRLADWEELMRQYIEDCAKNE
ncbi:hypothetical protein CRD59_05935 [Bifidobacterium xylocopae]|uniref:Uncharacterized protein n=1 Tax=Bifidobacterium xylocopae TaxID=2493119 RepID=A0A366KBN5_9BIFI|nr:hypothetical protein CRD59_05935 [Bifidobacterium xylocopae]